MPGSDDPIIESAVTLPPSKPRKDRQRQTLLVAATLCIGMSLGFVSLGVWLLDAPKIPLDVRVPGGDGAPAGLGDEAAVKDLAGTFQSFDGTATDLPGSWPRFRGSDFDNIRKAGPPLIESWGDAGPPILWSVSLGEGYAAPVILGGRVYVIDYDEKAKADAIRCFSLADGKEIWRRSYPLSVKRNHGMSRTIPAVTDTLLVTIGPRCHVVAIHPITGDFLWGIDLQREYGTQEPLWYTGQCPLIDAGQVILAPCGPDVLMMAVDGVTGAPVWKAPNPKKWDMSHSSILPMTIAGKKMYVYCAVGGISGVSAEGGDAGTLLWQMPWNAKVIAPSPLALDEGKIFLTAGYGEGGMMIQVQENQGAFKAEVLYKHGPKDGLASEQQTPIYCEGLLYGIMPKDAGALRSQLVCYRPDGTLVWSSGQNQRFGLGPYILADGKFYILDDEGTLTVARFSKDSYQPLAQAKVLHGQDAWGPIALAGDYMLLRDSKQMICLSVGKHP